MRDKKAFIACLFFAVSLFVLYLASGVPLMFWAVGFLIGLSLRYVK